MNNEQGKSNKKVKTSEIKIKFLIKLQCGALIK